MTIFNSSASKYGQPTINLFLLHTVIYLLPQKAASIMSKKN